MRPGSYSENAVCGKTRETRVGQRNYDPVWGRKVPAWEQTQSEFQRRGDLLGTPASEMHESLLIIRIYLQDARRMPSARHVDQMHTPHKNGVNRDDLSSFRVAHGTSWLSRASRAAWLPSETIPLAQCPGRSMQQRHIGKDAGECEQTYIWSRTS